MTTRRPGRHDPPTDDLGALLSELSAHDRMESARHADPGRRFLGGWNGRHPFVAAFIGDLMAEFANSQAALTAYSHLDEDVELCTRLSELHTNTYGESMRSPESFVPASGSSACLSSLLHYARHLGHVELCYLPPVYYNAIYWIRELDFRVTRVAPSPALGGMTPDGMALPPRRTLLWLTDPLWFAGQPLGIELLDEIRKWQGATGSMVIVDGTFQYMGWDGAGPEASAGLDPDLTFRLVCPTKTLALHAFRFAYVVAPHDLAAGFRDFQGRLHGAASLNDRLFAHRAISVLAAEGASVLWEFVKRRFGQLVSAGAFADYLPPRCGYFVFARPACDAGSFVGLSADCFEASSLDGFTRVNLLDDDDMDFLLGTCPSGSER